MSGLVQSLKNAEKNDKMVCKKGEDCVKIDVMAGAVAFFYEKVRSFVDYNEEHLLRKNAIFRILKRRFNRGFFEEFIEGTDNKKIAEHLVKELISARYFENNKVPYSKIEEVEAVIEKYHILFTEIKERHGLRKAFKSYNFIMGMAACEIEEELVPSNKEKVWLRFMYDVCQKNIQIKSKKMTKEQKELQLYLAVHRSLIKSDKQMLDYLLLKMFYPTWKESYKQIVEKIAKNIFEIKDEFEYHKGSKISSRLLRACNRFATMVNILKETIEQNFDQAEQLLESPALLEDKVKEVCKAKYDKIRKRLTTSIGRTIIYVFVTKMTLALLIEVPIEIRFEGEINNFALAVNILMPPLIMTFIGLSIKKPSDKNTEEIVQGIKDIIYGSENEKVVVKPKIKRNWFSQAVFNAFYIIAFLIPFTLILFFLRSINFGFISVFIFLIFLSIVAFFGVRIRSLAKELVVEKKKESLIGALFEFITLPLIQFGRWLSMEFSRINIFVFVMDFIIEAPLKIILEAFNNWLDFVKEKKEELY